jgi:hypothetical protein
VARKSTTIATYSADTGSSGTITHFDIGKRIPAGFNALALKKIEVSLDFAMCTTTPVFHGTYPVPFFRVSLSNAADGLSRLPGEPGHVASTYVEMVNMSELVASSEMFCVLKRKTIDRFELLERRYLLSKSILAIENLNYTTLDRVTVRIEAANVLLTAQELALEAFN